MVFRCGWNVISQETDFYFNKTAAQCWKEVTIFKSQNPQLFQKKNNAVCKNLIIESGDTQSCNSEVVKQQTIWFEDMQIYDLICL